MKNKIKKADASSVAPLFLFTLFAISAVFVLLGGVRIYKTMLERDRASFERRTVSQYLVTRMRQSDSLGGCYIGDFDSLEPQSAGDTLFYREVIEGEEYLTRIYCHEGYLCELFSSADGGFSKSDGERVIPVLSLSFKNENGLPSYNAAGRALEVSPAEYMKERFDEVMAEQQEEAGMGMSM